MSGKLATFSFISMELWSLPSADVNTNKIFHNIDKEIKEKKEERLLRRVGENMTGWSES
jgi:hypothetical protein